MFRNIIHLVLIMTLTFSVDLLYAEKGKVAKIIIKRGTVKVKEKGRSVASIGKGDWIAEGATLATGKKSFAKVLFVDKSQMNLGPNSQMLIKAFPIEKAGIITLMRGQLRAKVTKDYMKIKDKSKSKLFIQTKTAAMGVRGTDFQVNYNSQNQSTSLVTYSGEVRMAQIDPSSNFRGGQRRLERRVSSSGSVSVRKGQISQASPRTGGATIPVKLNPAQLKTLQKNEGQKFKKSSSKAAPKKQFRNVIPKGLDSKSASNDSGEMKKAMEKTVGKTQIKSAVVAARIEKSAVPTGDAGGKVDQVTGAVTMRSGGYLDPQTAQYIQPPPESSYDPMTDTYTAPPEYGGFDAVTGDYQNESFTLTPEGEFISVHTDDGRGPASEGDGPTAPPPLDPSACVGCDGSPMDDPFDPNQPGINADEQFADIEAAHDASLESIQNSSNVFFIIDTQ